MTGEAIYEIVKFWLPIATAFGLVIRGWKSAKGGVTQWADLLLNNHLSHIQTATEASASLLKEVRDNGVSAAAAVAQISQDLRLHEDSTLKVQRDILVGIEILKDRK